MTGQNTCTRLGWSSRLALLRELVERLPGNVQPRAIRRNFGTPAERSKVNPISSAWSDRAEARQDRVCAGPAGKLPERFSTGHVKGTHL